MGNKYEVWSFTAETGYQESYRGQWLILALIDMYKCKYNGAGCVKLEYR